MRVQRIVVMLLTLMCAPAGSSLDNGLARTPPMGWNSWATFELNIDEGLIRAMADAMVRSGLKSAGYEYVIVDAGWKAKKRDSLGRLVADPAKFPSGMKALADYVHRKGLKFGLYTDAGTEDCVSGAPGSAGFEEKDAALFAEWEVDYVKEDWCNTTGINTQEAYTKMSKAILASGRPMVFSMCEWGDNRPWEWAAPVANLWRTTGDSKDCWDCGRNTMNKPGGYPRGWVLILDAQSNLATFAGPGHWNDPDMLQVGHAGLNEEESRAHFSLWAILAAPLIATNDLRSMPPEIHDILSNREVIAIDQDRAGIEGKRVRAGKNGDIWVRRLSDGSSAVVLFNRSRRPSNLQVRWSDLGRDPGERLQVRDVWKHKWVDAVTNKYSSQIPAHGVVMLIVSGSSASQ